MFSRVSVCLCLSCVYLSVFIPFFLLFELVRLRYDKEEAVICLFFICLRFMACSAAVAFLFSFLFSFFLFL